MTLTQADLQAIGTLITESVKPLATKEDVHSSKMELYDELSRQYNGNDKRFSKLESMANTLLLQSDNTALLLRLINKQAEELEVVKAKVIISEWIAAAIADGDPVPEPKGKIIV